MLVVGDQEAESRQVSVRRHREGDLGAMGIDQFVSRARGEIGGRS
jgi:threonyl-tRNA synthetase